ncbi:helix-turn-helix domain-containing protein [uncultured Pseudacidovorax sp.]|uniref:helix-turn-helix domain-containing protein n=1 Tax=uncultured Pseudacidovorax sp. TaxID=679313 RepID=UPI0025D9FA05|nr:helix-turn-helix domain-containing protein [uncultured Pseudacidovorax sp.]
MSGPDKKKAPAAGTARAYKKETSDLNHSAPFLSTEEQRAKILGLLRMRPHTSYELRRAGCYQCPTRVFELRRQGYEIETQRVTVVDQDGFSHPFVALYSLADEVKGDGQ